MSTPARLTLHLGLPKSGTTYLQGLLASHREELRAAGAVYPFVRPEAMFRAAVEVREQHDLWGFGHQEVDGTWQALVDRVREVGLPGIISHEILAGASPEHAARVAATLKGFEVHLVVTCRDPLRQAMAHWQEEVKNGRPWSYAEFVAALPTPAESTAAELGFWRSQDLVDVLDRWSAAVPGATVHVVTAPPAGSPPEVLWRRFAEAAALSPDVLDPRETDPASGANRSLGAAQVRLLREVLAVLDGRIGQPDHAHVVKRGFAQQTLAARAGEPARPTAGLARLVQERTAAWPEVVRERGWQVHGDLADLEVHVPEPGPDPDQVPADTLGTPEELAQGLLEEVARRHDEAGRDGLLSRVSRRVRRGRQQPPTPRRPR
ncbi:sulfotransferase [Nocardioides marmoribigeumensis]|uniref:Sulfotransferase family protein n=1 Tax=Nocardioides marmoribigeumensis TaxID=433649 RepID=A0ABU2BXG1_9ACTN|nr:sulfotransferase [Nocardioides marmoribigeumensis]MDR7363093.1 hypothetical protein [Nocardioides marmoribigeumensis]